MKITAIKPFPVWVGHRNQLIVKIETDEGVFGWGESGLSGREKAVAGALEHHAVAHPQHQRHTAHHAVVVRHKGQGADRAGVFAQHLQRLHHAAEADLQEKGLSRNSLGVFGSVVHKAAMSAGDSTVVVMTFLYDSIKR